IEKITLNGAAVAYERKGKGSPLLLLPGIGASHYVWLPLLDRLSRIYDVIALDLPGLGGNSDPLPGAIPSSVQTLTDVIEAFIKKLDLKKIHVAGNSLGGGIALELGKRGIAKSVTVFSPIGFWRGAEVVYAKTMIINLRRFALLSRPIAPLLLRIA